MKLAEGFVEMKYIVNSIMSILILSIAVGCGSAREFSDEASLQHAKDRATERLAQAQARESDSYAANGLGIKSLDASSAVRQAQDEVNSLNHAQVNPHQDPLKNPDSSIKEQANNVKYEIKGGWRNGKEICMLEHEGYLNAAQTPEEILTTAKWMLEDANKKTIKKWKGWYLPGGTGSFFHDGKKEKAQVNAEFKSIVDAQKALLARVNDLINQIPPKPTKTS